MEILNVHNYLKSYSAAIVQENLRVKGKGTMLICLALVRIKDYINFLVCLYFPYYV